MISRNLAVGGLVATGFMAATTGADAAFSIDGAVPLLRTPFNAYPNSNLTFTDNIGTTGELILDEHTYGQLDINAGFFANRHNAWLSSDGGNTAHAFLNQEDFSVSFTFQLDATNPSPRKEAGFVISHPTTGTGQFILTSDNGEIASFSSFFPFTSNLVDNADGKEYGGTPYALGSQADIQVIYRHGVGSTATADLVKPASLEFIVNGISAGVRYLGNLENGLVDGTQFAFYVQSQPNNANLAAEHNTVTYSNVEGGSILTGDLNADGFVGIADLNIVLGAWNESQTPSGQRPPSSRTSAPTRATTTSSASKTSTSCWATGTPARRRPPARPSPNLRASRCWAWALPP
ncbi:MAG: hypothetical protein R3C45_15000 [Phycisphaerales bacterium]